MNIATNPWSFTNADQATTVAISSIVNNGDSALVTTASAHGYTLFQNVSIQGTTIAGYANGYKVLSIPSTTTYTIKLLPNQILLANNGANGNSLSVAYPYKVRIEQIAWQGPTAAGTLTITDTNGNLIWTYVASAADQVFTYGKVYWVDGLVMNSIPTGTVIITVN
jgi:hypothetical protein